MTTFIPTRRSFVARSLPYVGAVLLTQSPLVLADPATDTTQGPQGLDPVLVTAQALKGPQAAPSQGSLVATQPQSVVNADFFQANDAPSVNYTDIIKFTPSVWTVDPNGPGLMENLGTSIRGFQDGQFNVTLDGIPWGDSNDFTHHSTSYFMSQDMANVVVDRGPGNAATIGDATFGGTIYMQSADPRKTQGLDVLASYGSFNTQLYGVRYDTGEISEWNGARAFLSLKNLSSDGYLTDAPLNRTNAFFKTIAPINDTTSLTFTSNLNKLKQSPPVGATPDQMAAFGVNYAYNDDPNSQGYYNYNVDKITTDFEYIGLNSQVAGWTIDNKLYTYAYYHDGWNGYDVGGVLPNGATDYKDTPNGTSNGPDDVPGQQLTNNYRSVGDILRLSRDLGPGQVQFGGWFDHQTNLRGLVDVDFTDHQAYNTLFLTPIPTGALPEAAYTDRLQHNQLFSREAYLQYIWHVIPNLDVTAGDKYVDFERVIVAPVNQGTELPLDYHQNWTRDLPSADIHYKIMDNWSAYAQWAKGFLAPNLNVLYVDDPGQNTLKPESTTNVQVGTTWVTQQFNVSLDAYTINFSNEIEPGTAFFEGQAIKIFQNLGAVKYKGIEAEGTYTIGFGLSLYANATVNSAREESDQSWVPETPNRTAAIGLIYAQGPIQGSIMDKYVGVRYGDTEDAYRMGGYATTDAAINYLFRNAFGPFKHAKVGVTIQNLTDNRSIYFLNGYTNGAAPPGTNYANGNPLFFTVPGRSAQLNLSASF